MPHLGIDFGTSNCSMSYCSGDKPELIRDASGLDKIPTVVYWAADGKHKVGQAAQEMMYDTAGMEVEARFEILSRIVKSVKRNFFADRPIPMPDGSMVYPVDVAAEVLKYLKSNAEERCFHEPVRQVTLTHPVAFTEEQKQLLRQAGEKAGFTEIELLEEPVAAARGYVATGTKVGNGILVYDLGGGTFDLAYVHRGEDGEFHIPLPPGGDAKCGGDDFDNLLYDYAEQDLKKRHGISFSENASETNLSFYYLCRQLKEKLSRNEQGQLRYFLDKHGVSYTLPVTRTEFNKLIENKIGNTIRLTGQMLNRIAAAGYEVDTVLLIGASTRIPLVKAELAKILPVEPLETMHDDSAVALGGVVPDTDDFPEATMIVKNIADDGICNNSTEKQRKLITNEISVTHIEMMSVMEDTTLIRGMELYDKKLFSEALLYFRQAAEKGNPKAQLMLGKYYFYGYDIKKNLVEAGKWLRLAASQNEAEAQYMLGFTPVLTIF